MTPPAAGWYSDPADEQRMRYWNGSAWTDHVSPPDPVPPDPVPLGQPGADEAPGRSDGVLAVPPPPAGSSAPPVADAHEGTWGPQPAPPFSGAARSSVPAGQRPWLAQTPGGAAQSPGAGIGPDGQILSGFGRRLAGFLVDWTLVSAAASVLSVVVVAATVGFDSVIDQSAWSDLLAKTEADPGYQPTEEEALALFGPGALAAFLWTVGIWVAISFLNGVALLAGSGQTLGDRATANRKVRAGRRVPGFPAALLRWLLPMTLLISAPFLCLVTLLAWGLDHLWPLWDPMRRTWQDLAAGTVVERSDLIGPPQP